MFSVCRDNHVHYFAFTRPMHFVKFRCIRLYEFCCSRFSLINNAVLRDDIWMETYRCVPVEKRDIEFLNVIPEQSWFQNTVAIEKM